MIGRDDHTVVKSSPEGRVSVGRTGGKSYSRERDESSVVGLHGNCLSRALVFVCRRGAFPPVRYTRRMSFLMPWALIQGRPSLSQGSNLNR
jgi:hypothetical protein